MNPARSSCRLRSPKKLLVRNDFRFDCTFDPQPSAQAHSNPSTCKIFSYSYLVHCPGEAAALRNISAELEAAEMEEVQVRHARVTKTEVHAGVHGRSI